jgi:hypothetical protein
LAYAFNFSRIWLGLHAPKPGAAGLLKLVAIDMNGRIRVFQEEISIYSVVAKWMKFACSFKG